MKKRWVAVIIWLIFDALVYYVTLPAINVHSSGFWMFLIFLVLIPLYVISLMVELSEAAGLKEKILGLKPSNIKSRKLSGVFLLAAAVLFGFVIVCTVYGAPIFHAKKYASILQIQEYDFTEDIDESKVLSKVALMDTDSARILGNRKIGSLSDVVSQFDVAYEYTQIDYQTGPLKVAPLEYAGFFKYLANRQTGIPGYVTVDPVGQSTRYVTVESGMKYVPSSYFQKDLARHIRFSYPTAIFENLHFEIDEEGRPFYVASVMDYKIGLFNGQTIKGVITCDPISGDTQYYSLNEIPTWVDMAYSGDLLVQQFDWYGTYNNGFFNSLFAKKGCRKSTVTHRGEVSSDNEDVDDGVADYGYIAKEGDIWIYTGVTSVNEDASNIGFIMVNERTGEAHYFVIPGADENSAMNAAEGEVQEKRYKASFPSLINVQGAATYIMLLKDANDIVKMYAMVNVEQYNLVTTGETLNECYDNYCKLIGLEQKVEESNEDLSGELKEPEEVITVEFEIAKIQHVMLDGDSYVYFADADHHIYKQKFADNEQLLFAEVGMRIQAECVIDNQGVYVIQKLIRME